MENEVSDVPGNVPREEMGHLLHHEAKGELQDSGKSRDNCGSFRARRAPVATDRMVGLGTVVVAIRRRLDSRFLCLATPRALSLNRAE